MLSREENEILTRVGASTPMGELMRRYWIPALLSEEIPAPDCPPVRVRLLGEDLVAFRDSHGRIGLLGEHCAHRGTSLFFGRNEECGLRCIYHGWKYDVDGNILDTPAEPANSMIKHHVKHTAYPTHEVNGMIYAYMGPKERMTLIPALPWFNMDSEHVSIGGMGIEDCNWTLSTITLHRTLPMAQRIRQFTSDDVAPDGRKLKTRANDYLIDREKQRTDEVYSGLDASFPIQDGCVVESMGTLVDREHEHL